jgi:hypothetical protein
MSELLTPFLKTYFRPFLTEVANGTVEPMNEINLGTGVNVMNYDHFLCPGGVAS